MAEASNKTNKIVLGVKDAMLKSLGSLVSVGLEDAFIKANNQVSTSAEAQKLRQEKANVLQSFSDNAAENFDILIGEKPKQFNSPSVGSLSLIGDEDLEAIIAMEGMVAHARNCDIHEYLCFTTRLDTLLTGIRIDESNNPMDPEQIGDAFREAMRPVELNSEALLIVYRNFNLKVFKGLEDILAEANKILIKHGVLPELDIAARSKQEVQNKRSIRREKTDPTERAFAGDDDFRSLRGEGNKPIFSMMQNLMHGGAVAEGSGSPVAGPQGVAAPAGVPQGMVSQGQQGALPPGAVMQGMGQIPVIGEQLGGVSGGEYALQPGMMVGNQKVELVATDQLSALVSQLQSNFDVSRAGDAAAGAAEAANLGKSIGELLAQASDDSTLSAIDGQSSDIINLVTLIYEAIWHDDTVPIPVKELIGRTQITILKIALVDEEFFNSDDHPGRIFINELATAGISWTEFDKLEQDPMYCKMREMTELLIENYTDDSEYIVSLIADFKAFKSELSQQNRQVEERLKDAGERKERLEEIKEYAQQKIAERILDDGIDPFARSFLESSFHKFLVKLILKEGPGGISWKPVMNTIDVFLWTVQPDKQERDRERFEKLSPRLMQNLKKVLKLAGLETAEADSQLAELRSIQEQCFEVLDEAVAQEQEAGESTEQTEELEEASAEESEMVTESTGEEETESTEAEQDENQEKEQEQESEPAGEIDIMAELDASVEPEVVADTEPVAAEVQIEESAGGDESAGDLDILAMLEAASKRSDLPEDDEHLVQINKIPIGIWMEFEVEAGQSIRCTLAAKIKTIDKYVFVNAQGVKVVEKSRMGLARELKAGTVKIISEAPLVDRAMETVIGKLRDDGSKPPAEDDDGLGLVPK